MAIESPQPVKDPHYHYGEASLTPPVFFGNGAERLGIAGMRADTPEGKQVYMNLFEGYTTGNDGERIDVLHYRRKDRRGAFQYVITDPKDPSILREIGGDTRIDGLREKARAAAADYIERNAEVKVTKKSELGKVKPKVGRLVRRKTDNLVMVMWTHGATRDGDPSNHGHLVVFNISHDQKESVKKGIELYHVGTAKVAKVYRDAMKKGLNELGYKTRPKGNEYEIVGVPAEVKAPFSSRTNRINERIEDFEQKKGIKLMPEAKRKFSKFDIPEKQPNITHEERRKGWIARLTTPQFKAIVGVVSKAMAVVRQRILDRDFSRWQGDISRHASKLRSNMILHETEAPERSRNNGRSR